jgi:hypothetical protein
MPAQPTTGYTCRFLLAGLLLSQVPAKAVAGLYFPQLPVVKQGPKVLFVREKERAYIHIIFLTSYC